MSKTAVTLILLRLVASVLIFAAPANAQKLLNFTIKPDRSVKPNKKVGGAFDV